MSPGSSSAFGQSPSSYSPQNPGSTSIIDDSYEPSQSFSSPGSAEVTSDIFIVDNGVGHLDGTDAESGTSTKLEITQALRRLEEQLSLNEDILEEITPFCNEHETAHDSNPQHHQGVICKQEKSAALSEPDDQGLFYDGYNGKQGNVDKLELLRMYTCFKSVKYLGPQSILYFIMFTCRRLLLLI